MRVSLTEFTHIIYRFYTALVDDKDNKKLTLISISQAKMYSIYFIHISTLYFLQLYVSRLLAGMMLAQEKVMRMDLIAQSQRW